MRWDKLKVLNLQRDDIVKTSIKLAHIRKLREYWMKNSSPCSLLINFSDIAEKTNEKAVLINKFDFNVFLRHSVKTSKQTLAKHEFRF